MRRIKDALLKHKIKLLGLDNVVGVGIGPKTMQRATTGAPKRSIVILVREKLPEKKLHASQVVPKKLDGVHTDVIEVGHIRLLSRMERRDPIQPGVSIGHYKITAGTFGALVRDKTTGEPLILSNNHVIANGTNGRDNRGSVGDPVLQPGPHDGGTLDDVIGRVERFSPVHRLLMSPTCPRAAAAQKCANVVCRMMAPAYVIKVLRQTEQDNLIDAAVAKPVNANALRPQILGLGEINGIVDAEVGMHVAKSGRTTGVTKGVIQATDVTVQVDMGDGEQAVFHDQIIATPMSQGGDSGALVLDDRRRAVGLLFAGSDKTTVFNKIQHVMDRLSITF